MHSVLLLEDDDDLRETLALAIQEVDLVDVLAVRNVEELIALGPLALACACVVLDVNLGPGQPTGLDACAWLREQGYERRIIFLTGHASAFPQLRKASRQPNTMLLEKPAPLPLLLCAVEEASG